MDKVKIFADGMESVNLTEGMIRMELFQFAARSVHGGDVPHESSGELLMTPQGFFRAFNAMEDLVNQLVKAGVVKRNERQEGGQPAADNAASPNFN